MVGTRLDVVEAGLQVEDRPSVLDRHDASGGEAASVADPVDLVEDRHRRIAGTQEVGVQRVHAAIGLVDGAGGGDERLAGDLPAEHPLSVLVGLDPAEDVDLDRLEVEQFDQVLQGVRHRLMLPRPTVIEGADRLPGQRRASWVTTPRSTRRLACRADGVIVHNVSSATRLRWIASG